MIKGGARAPSQRQLRVAEEVRHVLARVIEREEFRDPTLTGVPITVSEVRISPDLKKATAFVLPLGGGNAILWCMRCGVLRRFYVGVSARKCHSDMSHRSRSA